MTIVWNDNLITGISVIDEQHQLLFSTINKLGKLTKNKVGFLEVLIELHTYVSVHFSTEEEYMVYARYPEYDGHKAAHDKFVSDYKAILKKAKDVNDITELGPDLVALVEAWIQKHYTDEDVKMAKFINESR